MEYFLKKALFFPFQKNNKIGPNDIGVDFKV